VIDDRPREFLQLSDGRYVRVTSTDDGELMPIEEPVKPQRARSGSASTAVAFSSHVVADAPGCVLCTWSPRDGEWALKFVNQACVLHRDDQDDHD
jgi:membrane-bound ClpP family serine protease